MDPRGNKTDYTYDGFGQLWERGSPDTGNTTWTYATDGQLQKMIRADGTQLTYTWDSLGRPTSISTGSQTRNVAYDSCTHGIGRVCSVSDATGTTSYAYDAQGDITSRTFTMGATSYALGYSYDGSGRIATITYPDGNQAAYHYADGRLSSLTATVGGVSQTVVSALTWRGGDRMLASWTAGNGLVTAYSYDGNGRLTGITVPGIQSLSFAYDNANRITGITNGIDASASQAFTYDAVNRLIGVTSPADNESYTYDANGNRTSQEVDGVTTPLAIEPNSNRLASVGTQAIGYDADGNVVSKGGVTLYAYNSFNRLESAGGATFYINPEGQRLRKSGPAGTTYFAPDTGGQLLADEPDGTWKDYVWMGGRMVGMLTGGTVYALHSDQTGRVLAITDTSQNVAWDAQGLAFTRNTTSGNPAFFRPGFPGQYWDVEDNLWHNGYRDYDPTLGRYIESDPIGLAGGLNTYAYVGNNSVLFVDPLGLKCSFFQKIANAFHKVENVAINSLDTFVMSHLGAALSLSAGGTVGITSDVSISEEHGTIYLEGYFGAGIVNGFDVSAADSVTTGHPRGFGAVLSGAAGIGVAGIRDSVAYTRKGGLSSSIAVGGNAGASVGLTAGYFGPIAKFKLPKPSKVNSNCDCGK